MCVAIHNERLPSAHAGPGLNMGVFMYIYMRLYSISQPDLSDETIGSLMIGSVTSLGTCEYPSASDVTSTYRVMVESGVQAFYVTSCNAFKMDPDGRTCTLYWSQSKTGNTTDENVYRLKNPNAPDSHETDLENALIFANSNVHVFSGTNYEHKHEQYDWDGEYNLDDEYNSIIVPGDRCVYLYSDVDLTGQQSEPIYTSQRNIVPGFRSIRIGSPSEDGMSCDYDVSDENYVVLPSRTGCVSKISAQNVDNLCAERTTSDDCEAYTWGPGSQNVCTWLG